MPKLTIVVISSRVTSSGLMLDQDRHEDVLSGGTAISNSISVSGFAAVEAGGVTSNDTISSGGAESVSAGGAAYQPIVLSGGVISGGGTLYAGTFDGLVSGVTDSAFFVSSGSAVSQVPAIATSNAVLSDVVLGTSAALHISGGTASGLTLGSGASIYLHGGYVGVVSASAALIGVDLGTVYAPMLVSDSTLVADGGAMVEYATVSSGSQLDLGGGADDNAAISSGGFLWVQNSGAVDIGADLSSGGSAVVEDGGLASATTILAGAVMRVFGAGSATLTTVSGLEVVDSASIDSTSVDSGGVLSLGAGVSVGNDCIVYGGGVLELQSLDIGDDFTLSSAYTSAVFNNVTLAGGSLVADQTTIYDSATVALAAGEKTDNVTVQAGSVLVGPGELDGEAFSYDYGLVSGVALGDAKGGHGELIVGSGGVASAVRDVGDGDQLIVQSGGLAAHTLVSAAQATLLIDAGGQASGTVLGAAGAGELVFGSAQATAISSGGVEYVESGGFGGADVVSNGGTERVSSGGAVSGTKVLSGGVLSIGAGGTAANATVSSGATVGDAGALVHSGAAAVFTGALSGKGQLVQDGPGKLTLGGVESGFTGQTVISGGIVEVATSTGPKGAVVFTGSGRLTLDAADQPASGAVFSETLSNFDAYDDTLDLVGLVKSAGAKATLNGTTLTVKDGGYIAKFKLAGSGASQYTVTADGAGGLLVRAASGASVSPLVHAMAAFDAPAATPGATTLLSAAGATASFLDAPGGLRSSTHAASA